MSLEKFSWAGDVAQVDTQAEAPEQHWRPRTRGDCETGPRPCPYVGCRHHLAMHVSDEGGISHSGGRHQGAKVLGERIQNGTTVEDWSDDMLEAMDSMAETCALDVADQGEMTLEDIGRVFGVSRERVRQIELDGLVKLRKRAGAGGLAALLDALASSPYIESAMVEAQGYASLEPGDVSAMREAKG